MNISNNGQDCGCVEEYKGFLPWSQGLSSARNPQSIEYQMQLDALTESQDTVKKGTPMYFMTSNFFTPFDIAELERRKKIATFIEERKKEYAENARMALFSAAGLGLILALLT